MPTAEPSKSPSGRPLKVLLLYDEPSTPDTSLQRQLFGQVHTAMDLDSTIHHVHGHLAGHELGHGGFDFEGFVFSSTPGGIVDDP